MNILKSSKTLFVDRIVEKGSYTEKDAADLIKQVRVKIHKKNLGQICKIFHNFMH